MLLRTRVTRYEADKIPAIERAMLFVGIAQNVERASDLTGDFVLVPDANFYLTAVGALQRAYNCLTVVEVGAGRA